MYAKPFKRTRRTKKGKIVTEMVTKRKKRSILPTSRNLHNYLMTNSGTYRDNEGLIGELKKKNPKDVFNTVHTNRTRLAEAAEAKKEAHKNLRKKKHLFKK